MTKSNFFKSALIVIATISILSCIKENSVITVPMDKKVIVINQGNYTEHSASISLYDEVTGQVENRVFETANGVSIGATIISGTIAPNKQAYLICNNPDKIEIIDSKSAKVATTPMTDGLESPRAAIVLDNRIYVSNWGYEYNVLPSGYWEFNKSYIAVYDLSTKAFIKKVLVGTDAEGIVIYGNRLFVAVKEGVRVLDITSDQMTTVATIRASSVTGAAKYLTFDKNARVWASFPDKGVIQVDPVSLVVTNVVEVPIDYMDGYITSDATGSNILSYHSTLDADNKPVKASIYKVNVETKAVTTLFNGTYFYGVGVSPFTGDIFTAEASFTSNSVLKVVTPDGTLRNSLTTGIGTCRYLFL